jgi:hypothetical protein
MMQQSNEKSGGPGATPFVQTYFHGTKADLKMGDLVEVGFSSNYGQRTSAKYIFLTATLDAAVWGAELAFGAAQHFILRIIVNWLDGIHKSVFGHRTGYSVLLALSEKQQAPRHY